MPFDNLVRNLNPSFVLQTAVKPTIFIDEGEGEACTNCMMCWTWRDNNVRETCRQKLTIINSTIVIILFSLNYAEHFSLHCLLLIDVHKNVCTMCRFGRTSTGHKDANEWMCLCIEVSQQHMCSVLCICVIFSMRLFAVYWIVLNGMSLCVCVCVSWLLMKTKMSATSLMHVLRFHFRR